MGKQKYAFWVGVAAQLSTPRLILTNHHVTDVSDLQTQLKDRPDVKILEGKLAVFITTNTDSPPVPTYIAECRRRRC